MKILGDGSDSGFTDIYRYRVADCEDGTRIIFVDCRQELESFRNTLVYRLDKLQKSTGLDLRVFEDAITFKIALMVVKYMKYMGNTDF